MKLVHNICNYKIIAMKGNITLIIILLFKQKHKEDKNCTMINIYADHVDANNQIAFIQIRTTSMQLLNNYEIINSIKQIQINVFI